MKSNEIKEKELKLKYEMEQLEKQHQEALVAEGKAYCCPKCKAFVDKEKEGKGVIESGLCVNCFHRKWNEDKRQKILKKLKFARIVDIELNGPYDIETITVYRNGMLYDLKAEFDDDDATIIIEHEYKDDEQHDLEEEKAIEIKPWEKERKEKPLILVQ